MSTKKFPSMVEAVAALLDFHRTPNAVFEVRSIDGFLDADECPSDRLDAEIASTLTEYFIMQNDETGLYEVTSGDARIGRVIAHYTREGEPIRFVAWY